MEAALATMPISLVMFIPLFVMILVMAGFAMQILGLVEAVSRPDFQPAERVGWTLAIFFLQLMGVIIYLCATDGKDLKTRVWLRNITILNVIMFLIMIAALIAGAVLAFLSKS